MESNVQINGTQEMEAIFLAAKEQTTTSVISGLHWVIYKACARDETLASIQMMIMSLAFEFCLKGVSRSYDIVDCILKKGKCPVLGKL